MFTEKRKRKTTKATERPLLAPTTAATRLWAWTMHLRARTASSEDRVTRETNWEFISHRTLRDAGVPALSWLYISVYLYLWGSRRVASRARNAGAPMVSCRPPAFARTATEGNRNYRDLLPKKKNASFASHEMVHFYVVPWFPYCIYLSSAGAC